MDKRHYSRVPFRVTAEIVSGQRVFGGNVDNLSINGMFVETTEQLPEGEHVEIALLLAGTDPELRVDLGGRVRRCDERGMAFQFDSIELESFTHLRSIIAYNTADPDRVTNEIAHVAGVAPQG